MKWQPQRRTFNTFAVICDWVELAASFLLSNSIEQHTLYVYTTFYGVHVPNLFFCLLISLLLVVAIAIASAIASLNLMRLLIHCMNSIFVSVLWRIWRIIIIFGTIFYTQIFYIHYKYIDKNSSRHLHNRCIAHAPNR